MEALALLGSEGIGTLDKYIKLVHSFPILSQDRELELARKLKLDRDLSAAQELILSHLRMVVSIARNYSGYGLPQDDLIQEGNVGLMQAVNQFDPERGVRLYSFAIYQVRAKIHEFIIKNWRMVKITTTKAHRKLFFNLRSMKTDLAPLTHAQANNIATQLNVKQADVLEMDGRFLATELPIDIIDGSDEDHNYQLIHYLKADPRQEPDQLLDAKRVNDRRDRGMVKALSSLDARARRIIEARWLVESGAELTLHQLGAELNISHERIRQIEKTALSKMKLIIEQELETA